MAGTIRTFTTDDGRIEIHVDGVSFETAAAISEDLFRKLGVRVPIKVTQAPEQHKPDVDHVHLLEHQQHRH